MNQRHKERPYTSWQNLLTQIRLKIDNIERVAGFKSSSTSFFCSIINGLFEALSDFLLAIILTLLFQHLSSDLKLFASFEPSAAN